jgi:uncharacterized damage-inducible protein DinB
MTIDDLRLLFAYNAWANGRILDASEGISQAQLTAVPTNNLPSLQQILLHALDTEYGWRMLCQHNARTPLLLVTDFPTVAAFRQRWQMEEAAMRDFLATLADEDVTRLVRYDTDSGGPRRRVLWHCLHHVVNHGTQHRSEAAVLLTDYGRSPGDLDFTVFLNEQMGAASL